MGGGDGGGAAADGVEFGMRGMAKKAGFRRRIVWFLAIGAAAAAGAVSSCGAGARELPSYKTVPEFTLTSQTGDAFHSREELAGKVWIAEFFFTSCTGPCPRMNARMRRLQNDLADVEDLRLVSFTVDPERDTPEALAEYARKFQAEPGRWWFLTGPMEELDRLCRETFLLGEVKGNLDHSTRFVLVDRDGVIRGYYLSGDSEAMQRLERDVRLLAGGAG